MSWEQRGLATCGLRCVVLGAEGDTLQLLLSPALSQFSAGLFWAVSAVPVPARPGWTGLEAPWCPYPCRGMELDEL